MFDYFFYTPCIMLFLGTSSNGSCSKNVTCDCESGDSKQLTPDRKEALFANYFQDKIISVVFRKNDDKNKKGNDKVTATTLPNVIRNATTPFSRGCNNMSKVNMLEYLMIKSFDDYGEHFKRHFSWPQYEILYLNPIYYLGP